MDHAEGGWAAQAALIEKEAANEQRKLTSGGWEWTLTPQAGERGQVVEIITAEIPRGPLSPEEVATICTFFDYYKEGETEKDREGNVMVKCVGGKGGFGGLKDDERPRIIRVLGAMLQQEGLKGCSWCGKFTKWMLLEGNQKGSVSFVHCTRCEGVQLSRRLQAYLSLSKKKSEPGGVGGYRGPLMKSAIDGEEGGDACEEGVAV